MKTYTLEIYDVHFDRLQALYAEKKRIWDEDEITIVDEVRLVGINSEIAGIFGAYLDDVGEEGAA